MKIFLICLTSLSLSACCIPPRPDDNDNTSHQFVSKKIPSELLDIPEPIAQPNLEGSQKDVAIWLIENEKRTRSLETKLQKIKEYNTDGK